MVLIRVVRMVTSRDVEEAEGGRLQGLAQVSSWMLRKVKVAKSRLSMRCGIEPGQQRGPRSRLTGRVPCGSESVL